MRCCEAPGPAGTIPVRKGAGHTGVPPHGVRKGTRHPVGSAVPCQRLACTCCTALLSSGPTGPPPLWPSHVCRSRVLAGRRTGATEDSPEATLGLVSLEGSAEPASMGVLGRWLAGCSAPGPAPSASCQRAAALCLPRRRKNTSSGARAWSSTSSSSSSSAHWIARGAAYGSSRALCERVLCARPLALCRAFQGVQRQLGASWKSGRRQPQGAVAKQGRQPAAASQSSGPPLPPVRHEGRGTMDRQGRRRGGPAAAGAHTEREAARAGGGRAACSPRLPPPAPACTTHACTSSLPTAPKHRCPCLPMLQAGRPSPTRRLCRSHQRRSCVASWSGCWVCWRPPWNGRSALTRCCG